MWHKAYKENRIKVLAALEKSGVNPWPHKFHVTISVGEFVRKYCNLEIDQKLDEVVSMAGMWKYKKNYGKYLFN